MKLFQFLAAGVALAFTAASCTKEKTGKPADPGPVQVASVEYVEPSYTEKTIFNYDATGKLTLAERDNINDEYSYNINGLGMFSKISLKNNPNDFKTSEYIFNEKGALTKKITKYPNGTLYFIEHYYYNPEGVIIKTASETADNPNLSYTEYDLQNGMAMESRQFVNGNLVNRMIYTYDLGKTLKNYNQQWRVYPQENWMGKVNKHPIANTKIYNASGQLTHDRKYSYEFNSQGDCTKISYTDVVRGETISILITYK
ncbi:hypothetical protein CAP36_08605 [Chitinophagaceae bacterium IBVUCB2]|nr:hypothetical protein CAP36_08605 [Chitinophagaceae bacterium IBVUCB2]